LKLILFSWILVITYSAAFSQPREKGGSNNLSNAVAPMHESGISYYPYERVLLRADALKMYAKSNGYNTKYAFIINMGMRSNVKRFFIVNLKSMCIERSGLVAHGKGDEKKYSAQRQYSNKEGSNCTSLGKYKIGKSYNGFFGLAYKLEGLEKTNSSAKDRNIVLHAMHCIPETPTENPLCVSEGCPAVADGFLPEIKKIIDHTNRPVLLLIYDSTVPGKYNGDVKPKK
jgi:L,D-transpeptidase catalytic domain